MERVYCVYVLSNKVNTVFYIGMTGNLQRRIFEHKSKKISGFTCLYNVTKLIYFEETNDVLVALNREKQLKGWTRKKKLRLILKENPRLEELFLG